MSLMPGGGGKKVNISLEATSSTPAIYVKYAYKTRGSSIWPLSVMVAYSSLLTSSDDLQCLMCADRPSGALVILSMDRTDRESLKFYSHNLIL